MNDWANDHDKVCSLSDLKCCPRCRSHNVKWCDGSDHNFVIKCLDCGMQTPEVDDHGYTQFTTYEKAKDWWNERIESVELQEWLKESIENKINYFESDKHNFTADMREGWLQGLYWFLSLRKEDENET